MMWLGLFLAVSALGVIALLAVLTVQKRINDDPSEFEHGWRDRP